MQAEVQAGVRALAKQKTARMDDAIKDALAESLAEGSLAEPSLAEGTFAEGSKRSGTLNKPKGLRRLRYAVLLVGLLAAVDAVPDIGATYAASGRLHVLMATESARRLQSRLVHIHTQTADDHATCERLRDGQKSWSCVDVTRGDHRAAQLWRHLAKYTSSASACRAGRRTTLPGSPWTRRPRARRRPRIAARAARRERAAGAWSVSESGDIGSQEQMGLAAILDWRAVAAI